MTMGTNVITREDLHELVWSTPMIKVAEKFEVSGSYLARVSTELRVPRPERGCWAKLAVGKAPQRPALSELESEFERGRVVGGVVKANGRANPRVTTFLRDARGLLVDRSQDVARAGKTDVDLLPALKAAIARAAAEGQPYAKTGGNGVYERRHELPEAFHAIGEHRLADWVGTLLDREEMVMAMAQGSKLVKWLDVPGGPVASGQAVFVAGHRGRSSAGRPDGD